MLDQVLHQSGMNLRLRDGSTTQDDWQMLLKGDPSIADNKGDFSDAVHQLGNPIARVNAIHASTALHL